MSSSVVRGKCAALLLLVLFLASTESASSSGTPRKFMMTKSAVQHAAPNAVPKEQKKDAAAREEVSIHPRDLRVRTNDYASYDSAPTLQKPPFKLIPN